MRLTRHSLACPDQIRSHPTISSDSPLRGVPQQQHAAGNHLGAMHDRPCASICRCMLNAQHQAAAIRYGKGAFTRHISLRSVGRG
jgi:hypothetical protein